MYNRLVKGFGFCQEFGSRIKKTRQAKVWKAKHYGAIPEFHKPHFIDIHDTYEKRSKEQVDKELKGHAFDISIIRTVYSDLDPHSFVKNRKAIIRFPLDQFNMTELQMERFKVLMGQRWRKQHMEKNEAQIVCEMYDNFEANLQKAMEQMKDVMYESKRAP